MHFRDWVYKQGGPTKLAKVLNVTAYSVHHWISGRASPTSHKIIKIMRIAKGDLTLTDIFAARENQVPDHRAKKRK